MNITRQRWKRFFFPKTVLFGLATAVVVATPAEAITFNREDDIGSASSGEVPTSTDAITEANNFAGGSYSSLTSFNLNDIDVSPSGATTGGGGAGGLNGVVDSSSDLSTGFNVDLTNSEYTKSGELLRINPQTSGTTVTFDLSTPATKFGLFISDYGNASGTDPISFDLLDSSDVSISSGTIPIPGESPFANADISGQNTRSIVFWGATIGSGDNPISSIVLDTNVSGVDRFAIDEVRVQPVPFEAETSIGLVLLGSYFGWRRFRRRKQALASEN